MPSKKKKIKPRKRTKKVPHKEVEFDFRFTDITMVEADGEYSIAKRLIEEDLGPHEWNISTVLTVTSPFGAGQFELNFRHDKSVYIIDYVPSTGNIYYNPDLSALSRWVQQYGWKVPQPLPALVSTNITFWKYMWETLLINSDYLEDRYGKRKGDMPPVIIPDDETEGLEVHDG